MTDKPKIYIAAPLFSCAELDYNKQLKKELSGMFDTYLPQEDGRLLEQALNRKESVKEVRAEIFAADITAIEACKVFLAVLDGRVPDEGVCMELGYAYSRGKLCIGLKTGPRVLLTHGHNPMISEPLKMIFNNRVSLIAWAQRYFN